MNPSSDMTPSTVIWVAIPVLNEFENIPKLLATLKNQTYQNFKVLLCINQPDSWWSQSDKLEHCLDNQKSIDLLSHEKDLSITLIDRSSKGSGWIGKQGGVPWARKVLFDTIMLSASIEDVVISLDADTTFSDLYFESILNNLSSHKNAVALSVPYYHQLRGQAESDCAILRYEIYMRYYNINMIRIESVYQFTALGSAMAFPVWSFRKIKGIKPKPSGEDFYLLQKFRKFGPILNYNSEKVYPSSRPSDRVLFGTGPAIINGMKGEWHRYPIYTMVSYDELQSAANLFKGFAICDIDHPVTSFFNEQLNDPNPWAKIRANSNSEDRFIRACHEKLDGLRILQYLKFAKTKRACTDQESLVNFLKKFYANSIIIKNNIQLDHNDLKSLILIRDELVKIEDCLLMNQWQQWDHKRKW